MVPRNGRGRGGSIAGGGGIGDGAGRSGRVRHGGETDVRTGHTTPGHLTKASRRYRK